MKNNYYESIADCRTGYLLEYPKKADVLNNARIAGQAAILPDSNNRALIIKAGDEIFLQSYDTVIMKVNETTGQIVKFWDEYSVTTMKHINTFLLGLGLHSLSKKEWLAL